MVMVVVVAEVGEAVGVVCVPLVLGSDWRNTDVVLMYSSLSAGTKFLPEIIVLVVDDDSEVRVFTSRRSLTTDV